MAFTATKREWSELYTFFRLLADGTLLPGDAQLHRSADATAWPIALIQREEHNGPRRYYIEKDTIRIEGTGSSKRFPRESFEAVAALILEAIKSSSEAEVPSPEEVEAFLDALSIYDLEAQTTDRTDLSIACWHPDAPLMGFTIYSRLGTMKPLLDGGRAANLKLELTGNQFPNPTVHKINGLESANEVADRMLLIESLGGTLKYVDVADKVFRCNLQMIDLHFPRLLAESLRMMHLDGITRVCELTDAMKQINPLKIKDELIGKHGYYEYKMKQFLSALALGMRPARIYTGQDSAIEGMLIVGGSGEILSYHKSDRTVFDEFLYRHTRFEKGDTEKDKYGVLERENGVYYFKLNAKVGLVKR
ncbi:MAG: HpaII family restriction endonuclease [Bacteroides sp.]|nr:HpaII family restriction endonuclease [Bacteroides sp.]